MIDLVEHVQQTIQQRRLFRRGDSILIAVSGGLDSMVLLDVLHKLAPENRWKISIAHFNHQLRGRSSDADERFVKKAAQKLEIPFISDNAEVHALAAKEKISIEMAARKARHEFFARAAKGRGIKAVALAHHANDQIELFLLRLLRGAGAGGLSGMKWQARSPVSSSVTLVRPLLDLSRKELEAHARAFKIHHREDATNAQTDFLRNRVRHKLIPLLARDFQPAFEKVLLRQMEILGAESEYLNDLAERRLKNPLGEPFQKLAVALQRRCLQMQLLKLGVAADFELVEKLRESPNRTVIAPAGVAVSRDASGSVQIEKPAQPRFKRAQLQIDIGDGGGEVEFGGARFRWTLEPMPAGTFHAPLKRTNHEALDAHKTGNCIVLRHWQAGDRFQPLGMEKAVKLQDLFTNAKIPRLRRREMVVMAAKTGDIIWVEGLRPGERYKLDKSSRMRLNWFWRKR